MSVIAVTVSRLPMISLAVVILGLILAATLLFAVLSKSGNGGWIAGIGIVVLIALFMCGGLFTIRMDSSNQMAREVRQVSQAQVHDAQEHHLRQVRETITAQENDLAEIVEMAERLPDELNGIAGPAPTTEVSVSQDGVVTSKVTWGSDEAEFAEATATPFDSTSRIQTYPARTVTVSHGTPFLFLAIAAIVVFTVILLIAKSSTTGWLVAGLGGLMLIFGTFFLLTPQSMPVSLNSQTGRSLASPNTFGFNSQSDHPYLYGTDSLPDIQTRLDLLNDSNELWTTAADNTLPAETYASLKQLGRGIGSRVVNSLTSTPDDPLTILVQPKQGSASGVDISDAITGCVERLKIEFPKAKVAGNYSSTKTSSPDSDGECTAYVNLTLQHVTRQTASWDNAENQAKFKIRTTLQHDDMQDRFDVEMIEKPWVDDLGSYLVSRPNYMLLRARSSELESKPSRARKQAEQAAAAEIVPQLQTFFTSRFPEFGTPTQSDCFEQLKNAISNNDMFVIDRFPQAVSDGRGNRLWREAVLLNVNTDGLESIAGQMASLRRGNQNRRMSLEAGLATLFMIILALGFVLNSLTKGYYQNRIGIGVGVGVIIICLLIVA